MLDAAHDDVPGVQGETQRFATLLERAHIPRTVSVAPGGHDWNYVAGQFPTLERFLETGWSTAGGQRGRSRPIPAGRPEG